MPVVARYFLTLTTCCRLRTYVVGIRVTRRVDLQYHKVEQIKRSSIATIVKTSLNDPSSFHPERYVENPELPVSAVLTDKDHRRGLDLGREG
jgi:hypothetical protein